MPRFPLESVVTSGFKTGLFGIAHGQLGELVQDAALLQADIEAAPRVLREPTDAGAHDGPPVSLEVVGDTDARGEVVARLVHDGLGVPAQTEVHRQLLVDLPLVLDEEVAPACRS